MELYVHIPFCVRKCRYCDFASFASGRDTMDEYVALLLKEAEYRSLQLDHPEISTVYIGGGTPSVLPPDLMDRLLSGLLRCFDISPEVEISVEANPGTVTPEWLDTCLSHGVNRFSVGMQASQDNILAMLGRIHRFGQVCDTVSLLQSRGVHNYSLDLMFGLPGQSMDDWMKSVKDALSLRPVHFSCYGLIPEDGTPLKTDLDAGKLTLPEPELERDMYYAMRELLLENGYRQYEISNFAMPGYECVHNIGYWTQVPYLGLGLSAASMLNVKRDSRGIGYDRLTNPSIYTEYKTKVCLYKNKLWSEEAEHISFEDARFETVMLGLRLTEGISEDKFHALHGCTMETLWPDVLSSLVCRGLITKVDDRWKLTDLGMDLQNSVLIEFME